MTEIACMPPPATGGFSADAATRLPEPAIGTPAVATPPPAPFGPALVETLIACLRADGHLANVMWHISHSWPRIEASFTRLLGNEAPPAALDALDRNLLRLLCDGEGPTGRRMAAFLPTTLVPLLGERGFYVLSQRLRALRDSSKCREPADDARPARAGGPLLRSAPRSR